jgi:hypothetical protein
MNENAIRDAYDLFVGTGYTKSYEDFKQLINSNPEALQDAYGLFVNTGYKKDINSFKTLMGVAGGTPDQPQAELKKKDQFGTTVSPSAASSSASQSPSSAEPAPAPEPVQQPQQLEEKDYFTGAFGDVLRGFDDIVPLGIGDFVDDMARSVAAGYGQAQLADEAGVLALSGSKATPEEIQKFIEANKNAQQLGQSKEAQEFNKIYNEEGGGFWGVVKGLALNPSYVPEIMTSSLVGLATNSDALVAGASAIGTGASYGGATGSAAGGVGAAPGALAGAVAAIPYAFGLATGVVEAGSYFAEELQNQLQGKEMTKENVKAILEDPEKLQELRNGAITRGIVIGTADALTGKLASKVGANILSKSAAKSATGAATKAATTGAVAAGSAIEAAGGSAGELAARAATGQKMDTAEILLEGISELPGGVRSTIQARLAKPEYKVNGAKVSAEEIDKLIATMTPAQLQKTKIDIKNDYEGRQFKIQDKIVTDAIKNEVKQANPDLNNASVNAITQLEKELRALENNKTQVGKDKVAEIKSKIKDIQDNQLPEEVEVVNVPAPEKPTEKIKDKKSLTEVLDSIDDDTNDEVAFLDENDNPLDVRENRDRVAQEYFDALEAENNGQTLTQSQLSAKTIVEKIFGAQSNRIADTSWANDLDDNTEYELNFQSQEQIPNLFRDEAVQNEDGTFTIKRTGADVKNQLKMDTVNSFNDNQMYTFDFNSMEEVPDEYRINVREIPAIEAQRKLLGVIPMGKSKVVRDKIYRVSISGADAKKLKLQPQRAANKSDIFRNTAKSLASIFPDLKIVSLANMQEMRDYALQNFNQDVADTITGAEGGMVINDASNKPIAILINEETSIATTMPHEAWHAILVKAFGDNPALFEEFKKGIEKALRDNGMTKIIDALDNFSNQEDYINSNMQAEEWLVELGGLLTSAGITYDNLTPKAKSLLTQIKAVFNSIAIKITGQPMFLEDATPEDMLDFMVTISDRMARGMSLTEFFRDTAPSGPAGAGVSSKTQRVPPKQKLIEQAQLKTNYFLPNMMGGVNVLTPENYAAMLQEFIDTGAIENVDRYSTRELTESQFPLEESNGVNPMSLRDADAAKFELEGVKESMAKAPAKTKKQIVDNEFSISSPYNEDGDIDLDVDDQASELAKKNGVNILRGKNLTSVIYDKNRNVVGGLWTEVDGNEFSFDVVVDESVQGKKLGEKLVNEAISEFNNQDYDDSLVYKVDVTNPIMEKLLSKYGFEVEDRIQGHTMMVHPTNNPKLQETKTKKQAPGKEATLAERNVKTLPEGLSIIDGWYSPIEKRLKETKVEKQSANKWLTGGLIGKGDEAIYTGVKGWLEQMNPQSQVTKDQILNWLDNNRVEIVEVEKTATEPSQEKVNRLKEVEDKISEIEKNVREKARNEEGRIKEDDYIKMLVGDDGYYSLEQERRSLLREFSNLKDDVKYRAYQLPGERKNYKEVLVTLPKNKSEVERLQDLVIQANNLGEFDRANEIERRINKLKGDEFDSSHFNETNIAVHLRMNTRTDSDGNKVLFLEEVQSDWGQQGKKRGFVSKEISDKINDLQEKYSKSKAEFYRIENELDEQYDKKKKPGESKVDLRMRDSEFNELAYEYLPAESKMFEDERAFYEFQVQYGDLVPSGPFVSNTNSWVKLGLKIALREAEKQGADYIAWTTGEQQNERYDLSKQVEKIDIEGLEDNVQLVDIKLPDGSTDYLEVENGIIRDGSNKGQRLDNVIGKEYADKVISTPANENRVLEGEGLKMGGSGMKGFYDKIVPDVFKSLMKEITGSSTDIETVNINGNQQQAVIVTPEAKTQVKEGIAKFQRPTGNDLLEVQKIGKRYNINDKGFMPKQANEFALAKEIARFGLGAKRSKVTPEGYGGSVYMTDPAGKFFNPFKVKKHRVSLSGGKLNPNVNTIEGYDRMMEQVQNIIDKSERRGVAKDKIMQNVMEYVTKSKVYERANDSQREQLVRNIETEFGKKQKSAPSIGKILGTIKNITKITLPEKELLKQHFRDLAKGARDAKRAFMQASDDLSLTVSELAKSGKISPKQLSDVIRKFSKVNMLNEDSTNAFVDYMTKVFEDADYAEKIAGIRTKITKARGNLKSKIGVADAIANPMRKLLAVNPTLIPDDVFDKYLNIINMFSASQAVLPLKDISDISQDINDIFQSLDEQLSKSEELAIRFNDFLDKVVNEENGKIQYADTVNKMEKDGIVTAEEAELMKKYKSVIFPKEQKEAKTAAEIKAENNLLIKAITAAKINLDRLTLKDERELADNIRRLLKPELLNQLTTAQLTNLIKLIDNINNGFMPHYGELAFEGLNAIKNSTPVGEATLAAKLLPLTKIYNNLKSKLTKRTSTSEMVRSGGFFFIDQILGNFKAKVVFNALFEKISEANAVFTSQLGQVNKKLDSAKDAVVKSFNYDANKTLESSFRMMAYMIQLEYESNPGNKQVNPASAYIKETIKAIKRGKTMYGDKEIEMLERILDENGNVDKDALYNSFNKAEKNAIKTIREINDGLTEKAVYTAAVIRGQRIDALNNYIHLPVMSEYNPDESAVATKVMDEYNSTMNPSTKGKNLIERTSGAKAINFDVFASAQRGAKFTLLDYHMTTPIRTARKTLNEVENRYGDEFTKQQREIFNAMRDGFEEVVSNVLTNNFMSNSTSDEVIIEISKQGYRAVLGSAFRFVAEFLSNIGFVMVAGKKSFIEGVKYFSVFSSPDGVKIMENVSSKQITRLFHGDTLSGKFIDTSMLNQASGVKSATAKGTIANKANQIYNMSLKKYKNGVELIADTLISTPDRVVMRPVWFGQFATEFKKQAGKDVDFKKIADNNEAYIRENKDAIEAAKLRADEMSVLAGATDNPFMGMVKGTTKPNQGSITKLLNMFNGYMTRFALFEYTTARQGIYAAMGNGSISRAEGIALLAAVTTRMTLYTFLINAAAGGLAGLLGDEEEEDEKTLMQKVGRAFASTASSLLLGRNFGNATKSLISVGVEEFNEAFLDDLRNGKYDPYKDAISSSAIPKDKKGGDRDLSDLLANMLGPFAPSYKATDLIVRKALAKEKKEPEAIKRSEQENMIRIPLEVLGNAGMIPLYKDVRREVMNGLYKDLRNADKKAEDKKQAEKEMLHGYENKEDMKRYDPELYDKVFGKDSPGYDAKEAKRKLKHEADSIERRIKDEFYEYVPKKKDGFGSGSNFGSESKKKSVFGSKGGFGGK